MLADLMTRVEGRDKRAVFIEPSIGLGGLGDHVRDQVDRLGLAVWPKSLARPNWGYDVSLLEPSLAMLDRWGLKEVNPDSISGSMERMRPERLVLLVRRMCDAAASLYIKDMRERPNESPIPGVPTPERWEWMRSRMERAIAAMEDASKAMPPERQRWVSYEQLVSSPEYRDELGAWMDWPLDGDPCRRLDLYQRDNEREHHSGKVTSRSVHAYQPGKDVNLDRFVNEVVESCRSVCVSRPDLLGL